MEHSLYDCCRDEHDSKTETEIRKIEREMEKVKLVEEKFIDGYLRSNFTKAVMYEMTEEDIKNHMIAYIRTVDHLSACTGFGVGHIHMLAMYKGQTYRVEHHDVTLESLRNRSDTITIYAPGVKFDWKV